MNNIKCRSFALQINKQTKVNRKFLPVFFTIPEYFLDPKAGKLWLLPVPTDQLSRSWEGKERRYQCQILEFVLPLLPLLLGVVSVSYNLKGAVCNIIPEGDVPLDLLSFHLGIGRCRTY